MPPTARSFSWWWRCFYKLVLVVIGLMLPVVWLGHMREYLGSWLGLYVVGIVLNVVLVALLCGVMFSPGLILNIMCGVLAAGERCGIVKTGKNCGRTRRLLQGGTVRPRIF